MELREISRLYFLLLFICKTLYLGPRSPVQHFKHNNLQEVSSYDPNTNGGRLESDVWRFWKPAKHQGQGIHLACCCPRKASLPEGRAERVLILTSDFTAVWWETRQKSSLMSPEASYKQIYESQRQRWEQDCILQSFHPTALAHSSEDMPRPLLGGLCSSPRGESSRVSWVRPPWMTAVAQPFCPSPSTTSTPELAPAHLVLSWLWASENSPWVLLKTLVCVFPTSVFISVCYLPGHVASIVLAEQHIN